VSILRICDEILESTDPLLPPTDLRIVIASAIKKLRLNVDDAEEHAHSNEQKIFERLDQIIENAKRAKIYCHVQFSTSDKSLIQGSLYSSSTEDDGVKLEKKRRACAPKILESVRSLSDTDFEFLCGLALKCLAVDRPFVSKQSGDQGVDFFGKADFARFVKGTSQLETVTGELSIWLVGQAKRYNKTKVTTSALRELVGSLELVRARAFADNGEALRHLQVRVCEPTFLLLVTSGVFTSGSHELLKNAGIIGYDGERLSLLLADHGIGLDDDHEFDEKILKAQIAAIRDDVNEFHWSP
jgi:hypothetical protein